MTQMSIGAFSFNLSTAQYQSLTRLRRWDWQQRQRFGAPPVREYHGRQAEVITVRGVVWVRTVHDADAFRLLLDAADAGTPSSVQSVFVGGDSQSSGNFIGNFVIDDIKTNEEMFRFDGVPMIINFTIDMSEAASV